MKNLTASPEDRFIEVNGQSIHVKQWSSTGPLMVFLHHITGDCGIWNDIAPAFISEFQVVAVDLRGHGLSSNPTHGYRWVEDLSEDIVELIKFYASKSVTLVGFSLGAMVAIPVAVKMSDRVSALILEDPPLHDHARNYNSAWWEERRAAIHLPFDQKVDRLIKRGNSVEEAKLIAEIKDRVSPGVLDEYLAGTAAYHFEDWLPKVSCKTCLFLGNPEKGSSLNHADRKRVTELFSFSHISEWKNAGHGVHEVDPVQFIHEMKQFLQAVGNARPVT